ncbi:MAG: SGNH/GDSL hydrolase family protein [Lachnospiraceae bacterium]|nr:SGNH/GDSL hydrolase family protein [Lachnospiraceae bacterium]
MGNIPAEIKILGRTSKEAPDVLFWTGSRYEMNVRASYLTVRIEAQYGGQEQWIAVLVNRALVCRMPLLRGENEIIIFRNRNASEVKNVCILKEVQPMGGDGPNYIRLTGVETDGEFLPVDEPKLRLMFIGDSITSGEGAMGAKSENDWVAQLFSGVNNYAFMTAEALGADYQVVSQSGWGVYCGYNNDYHMNVPGIYDRVCALVTTQAPDGSTQGVCGSLEKVDYSSFTPDVAVINLATNDGGACGSDAYTDPETGKVYKMNKGADGGPDVESTERFAEAAVAFLEKLRAVHPKAYLLWVYGMLGTDMERAVNTAIERYRERSGDERVGYQRLPDTTPEAFGARWHPGTISHQRAAEVITNRIREILGSTP